ncbi:hypothetical protein COOONC_22642, partial [Cooperia oncophora]
TWPAYVPVTTSTVIVSSGLTAFWEDTEKQNADGLDSIAKEAVRRVISCVNALRLFCATDGCLTNDNKARGNYARQLHDTFYMFGSGLSREPTYYHDATNLTKAMAVDFSGLTGEVEMTENNTRVADFMLYYLDTNFQQHIFMKITYKDAKMVGLKGKIDMKAFALINLLWRRCGHEFNFHAKL